jgi:alkanesulfonate monooxygenase SsuD/methylene tetrahydromethanopterin reductase-like flavin-dependent oxidoreductase (luciferase family)
LSRPLLGVTLPQFTDDPVRFVEGARRAEAAGLDSVWVFDHLWPLGQKQRPLLEGWTALAHLAAATKRISIGTLVTRSSLRHPALLAKMAATVAAMAGPRFVLAIGAGDRLSRFENVAFGLPYFSGDERVAELASTVEVTTSFLGSRTVQHRNGLVDIRNLPTSPRPNKPPEVWVGGWNRQILELAGSRGDGWNGWGKTPDDFSRAARVVAEAAGGRPVTLTWGGQFLLAETEQRAGAKLGERDPSQFIVGAPATVAAELRRFVRAGASHLIAAFPDAGTPGTYELLATDVRDRLQV